MKKKTFEFNKDDRNLIYDALLEYKKRYEIGLTQSGISNLERILKEY